MSTPEGRVKEKVKSMLKQYSAYQHWPVQTGFGAPTLDCIGCHRGLYFGIETKAPGKHLTPRQQLTKRDIETAGGLVFVVGESNTHDGFVYSGLGELYEWLNRRH